MLFWLFFGGPPLAFWLLAGAIVAGVLAVLLFMSDGASDMVDPPITDTRGPDDR